MKHFEEIKLLFARSYYSHVTKETSINYDLELMGDDADLYMQKFFESFGIDQNGFDFDKFFHQEMGLKYLYYKIFSPNSLKNKRALTLEHLTKVAELGAWFDPINDV